MSVCVCVCVSISLVVYSSRFTLGALPHLCGSLVMHSSVLLREFISKVLK